MKEIPIELKKALFPEKYGMRMSCSEALEFFYEKIGSLPQKYKDVNNYISLYNSAIRSHLNKEYESFLKNKLILKDGNNWFGHNVYKININHECLAGKIINYAENNKEEAEKIIGEFHHPDPIILNDLKNYGVIGENISVIIRVYNSGTFGCVLKDAMSEESDYFVKEELSRLENPLTNIIIHNLQQSI